MSHDEHKFPMLDAEHDRRLFDPDLVEVLRKDYGPDWDSMSELEQIEAQIYFVLPYPPTDRQKVTELAKRMQAKIKLGSTTTGSSNSHLEKFIWDKVLEFMGSDDLVDELNDFANEVMRNADGEEIYETIVEAIATVEAEIRAKAGASQAPQT